MNMKGKLFENMNTSAKSRYCRTVCEFIAVSAMFALIALGFGRLPERVSEIYTVSAGTDERGRVVVIDAGHGGEDGGASGENGLLEKDINLDISARIKTLLDICGVDAEMTRTDDRMLYDMYGELSDYRGKKKTYDLKNRLRFAKEANADALISIHMNKFHQPQYSGLQVYYSPNNSESEPLAAKIQEYAEIYIQPENEREIKRATSAIYIMKHTEIPAVLVECGFLSNPEEAAKLADSGYRTGLAVTVSAAAAEWLASPEAAK